MSDLIIEKIDTVNIKVRCERGIAMELSDFFTFKVPGYKFMPQYKNKMWDGTIKLYNVHTQTLYSGLLNYIYKFAEDRSYNIKLDNPEDFQNENSIIKEETRKFVDSELQPIAGGEMIVSHEHQVKAITHAINNDRCLLLSPTASGKSLIIYSLIRIPKNSKYEI